MRDWLKELGRRNVIRVSLAYIVAAWLILQVADLVLGNIGAPAWVMQVLMLVVALGFPVIVAFSWVYELTPEGLRRESDIDRSQSITPQTGHKLDRLIIGLLVLVLFVVGAQWLVPDAPETVDAPVADTGEAASTPAASGGTDEMSAAPAKSIAVLAFKDLSPEGNQEYFADGISEELLNVLAQVPGLKVAGRTSSFAFKEQNRDLREIGEILEVANILEGSVRTDGSRVRVTAQLIKADDGYHLFSRNYDRDLTDIFQVQDDIANEIAVALKATILGDAPVESVAETNPVTYENYLKARQWIHTRDHDLMEDALTVLNEALAEDPDYAPALAQKALALILLSDSESTYGDIPLVEALAESGPLLTRALEIDPQSADAHAVRGLWLSVKTIETNPEAIAELRRALEINPTLTNAINWLASELPADTGYAEAMALFESAMERDPLYRPAFNNLVSGYVNTRRFDDAEALIRRVERVSGESPIVQLAYGMIDLYRGQLAAARDPLEKAWAYNTRASVAQAQYGTLLLQLGEYEQSAEVMSGMDRLLPLRLLGRSEDAEAEIARVAPSVLEPNGLFFYGDWLLAQDRSAELIAAMQQRFGAGDAWLENLPAPLDLGGTPVIVNAAAALLRTGQDDAARQVLRVARQQLDTQRALGADNPLYWLNEADYAALTGDVDTMLGDLGRAVDSGHVSVAGFTSSALDKYRGDPRFVEVEQRSRQLARAEREKLGLPKLTT